MSRSLALRAVLLLVLVGQVLADAPQAAWTGNVVGVTDGDTIEVMHNGKAAKIRLHGIDCPEDGQPFSSAAKKFTSDKCFGQQVTVQPLETDKYGRTVANVVLPNREILNHLLVKNGLAWWYKQYAPRDIALQRLQLDAITNNIGLWSEPNPIEPWSWRAGTKSVPTPPPPTQSISSPQITVPEVPVTAQETVPDTSEIIVFVTNTGTKYHAGTCRYLSKSKIPMSLSDALSAGYAACSVCGGVVDDQAHVNGNNPGPAPQRAPPPVQYISPTPTNTPRSYVAPQSTDSTVYITRTGQKYHRGSCRYLRESSIPISLSQARERGFGECSVCSP